MLTSRPTPPEEVELYLEPGLAARKKAARELRLELVQKPWLRAGGSVLLALTVLLHNAFYLRALDWSAWLLLCGILIGYWIASWAASRLCFRPLSGSRLPLFFLTGDIVIWLVAIYLSGGPDSLLFVLMLLRAADQSHTTTAQVLFFGHFSVLGYVGLLLYVSVVDAEAVSWLGESSKLFLLYAVNLYIAMTTRTAERLRRRTREAVHVAQQLIRALAFERDRAEGANRAKDRFLANMSHELRTPMNAVLGMTELTLDSELSEEQRSYLELVHASAGSLLGLLDELLDFAKSESDALALRVEEIEIGGCVEAAYATVRESAAKKGLEIETEIDPAVPAQLLGDAQRLTQVLTQLLDNAVKFTDAGSVRLSVRVMEQCPDSATLQIDVADSGIGITSEDQERIFEAFTQVDGSSTRPYGGVGLGLTVARRLAGLMDGQIWVDSEPGQGSTFHFRLTLAQPAAYPALLAASD